MPDEKYLDASDMEPPRPFEEAVKLLAQLQPGEFLRMSHRQIPYPLFDYCREHAFVYRLLPGATARYDILIWHEDDGDMCSGWPRDDA